MEKPARQTLSIDLDSLFPGESLEIGNSLIIIRPLSIEQIAILSKKIKGFGSILSKEGLTWENYNNPEGLFKLSVVILENFPDILEEAANVDIDDLRVLPLELIVKIVEKIISVNLKSKEALEKNFKSLAKNFTLETDLKKGTPLPKKMKKK